MGELQTPCLNLVLLLVCWGTLCVNKENLPLPNDSATSMLIPSDLGTFLPWEGACQWEESPLDLLRSVFSPADAHSIFSTKVRVGFPGLYPFGAENLQGRSRHSLSQQLAVLIIYVFSSQKSSLHVLQGSGYIPSWCHLQVAQVPGCTLRDFPALH